MAARMARGAFDADGMLFARGRRITLEAPSGILAEVDGDVLAGSRLAAEVLPLAATFLGGRRR
jgi:diacylglycerol kinase family enzyme